MFPVYRLLVAGVVYETEPLVYYAMVVDYVSYVEPWHILCSLIADPGYPEHQFFY
jgi:hypothetical protein